MNNKYKKQLANNTIKLSIEETENNFTNNSNCEIELEFQNIFNLSIVFGEEWMDKQIATLEKRLIGEGFTIPQLVKIRGNALNTGSYTYHKIMDSMQIGMG